MEDVVVGLDIGSTKTCAVIGFLNENGLVEIAGVGVAPSRGLKNGVIINIDNTQAAIAKAIEDAELMAGCEIAACYVAITGSHIKGENSPGVVAVSGRNRSISAGEIRRVIQAAQAIVIPADREIMHVLSREFAVDDQRGIKDPIGMTGVRLEAEVHIVTGSRSAIINLTKSVNASGIHCQDIVFSPLAAAEAVLSAEEMELGVAVVDIGGGTTDIAVFSDGGVAYTSVLPVGGRHVTNDISIGLSTPAESAEMIKKKHGLSLVSFVDASETVEVPSVGDRAPRRIMRMELARIIEPRMFEIMEMIERELLVSGKKDFLAAGVVLTGGGAMLEGTVECAERVFRLPVRIGRAKNITGMKDIVSSPQYANAVGLVKYGIKTRQYREAKGGTKKQSGGLKMKMKKWFQDYL
ncbi:MAG: cell division protein FtsA [Spirochaetes bacterium]|nr:cell division protein FtsA [Spirochaetota bacterium]MBN2772157.1 cell division protein FtsA [Spirochaetota bacterium]HRX16534.1 cell division protein FtsA [Spirochaetota bacterium]